MQRRLTMQIFYRQMLWSSQLIACDGRQLINLIASMYEYPKEILISRLLVTTANIGGYFIFNIADYDDSQLEKYTIIATGIHPMRDRAVSLWRLFRHQSYEV